MGDYINSAKHGEYIAIASQDEACHMIMHYYHSCCSHGANVRHGVNAMKNIGISGLNLCTNQRRYWWRYREMWHDRIFRSGFASVSRKGYGLLKQIRHNRYYGGNPPATVSVTVKNGVDTGSGALNIVGGKSYLMTLKVRGTATLKSTDSATFPFANIVPSATKVTEITRTFTAGKSAEIFGFDITGAEGSWIEFDELLLVDYSTPLKDSCALIDAAETHFKGGLAAPTATEFSEYWLHAGDRAVSVGMGVRPTMHEGVEVEFVSKATGKPFSWAGHVKFIVTGAEGEMSGKKIEFGQTINMKVPGYGYVDWSTGKDQGFAEMYSDTGTQIFVRGKGDDVMESSLVQLLTAQGSKSLEFCSGIFTDSAMVGQWSVQLVPGTPVIDDLQSDWAIQSLIPGKKVHTTGSDQRTVKTLPQAFNNAKQIMLPGYGEADASGVKQHAVKESIFFRIDTPAHVYVAWDCAQGKPLGEWTDLKDKNIVLSRDNGKPDLQYCVSRLRFNAGDVQIDLTCDVQGTNCRFGHALLVFTMHYGSPGHIISSFDHSIGVDGPVPVKHVAIGSDDGESEWKDVCYDSPLKVPLLQDSYALTPVPSTADGLFDIDVLTGQVFVKVAGLDYETSPVFNLMIAATDRVGAVDFATFTVVLTTVNERPSWVQVCPGRPRAFSCPMVWENSKTGTDIGSPLETEDQDSTHAGVSTVGRGIGHKVEWEIKGGNWGDVFKLGKKDGQLKVNKPDLNHESKNLYDVIIGATDNGSPPLQMVGIVAIDIGDVNEPPEIEDGTEFKTIECDNEACNDGEIVGEVTVFDIDDATQDFGTLVASITRITGGKIDYNDDMAAPKWNKPLGSTMRTFQAGTRSVLDKDGTVVSYMAQVKIASGASYDHEGDNNIFLVRLRITDAPKRTVDIMGRTPSRLFSETDVVIRLRDRNEVPTFDPFVLDVPEISSKRTLVGEPMVNGAGDPDIYARQKLAFTIQAGNDDNIFAISECDGQLKVARNLITQAADYASWEIDLRRHSELNFESGKVWNLLIRVTDNGVNSQGAPLFVEKSVRVVTTDVNEAPFLTDAAWDSEENRKISHVIGSMVPHYLDDDQVDTSQYFITDGNTPDGIFSIGKSDGIVRVRNPILNFEAKRAGKDPVYNLEIMVVDKEDEFAKARAIITILNVNERPTLTKRLITIPENTIANINIGAAMPGFDVDDTHTALIRYSLVDDKFGMFDINSITGQISTTKWVHTWASSHNHRGGSEAQCIPSEADLEAFAKARGNGSPFGRKACRVVCSKSCGCDPENIQAAEVEKCRILREDECQTWCDKDDSGFWHNRLDYEVYGQKIVLVVRVTDPDGAHSGPNGNKGEDYQHRDMDSRVTIALTNVNENPIYDGGVRECKENSNTWTPVGAPVLARDNDVGDKHTYTIISEQVVSIYGGKWMDTRSTLGSAAFDLHPIHAQIIAANPIMNYETHGAFQMIVQAVDNGGLKDQAVITITLINVNEVPVWYGGDRGFAPKSCPAGWLQYRTDQPNLCCDKLIGCPVNCAIQEQPGVKSCTDIRGSTVMVTRPAGDEERRGCVFLETGEVVGGCRVLADPVDHPDIATAAKSTGVDALYVNVDGTTGVRQCTIEQNKVCAGSSWVNGMTTTEIACDDTDPLQTCWSKCSAWCRAQTFAMGSGCQYEKASGTCGIRDSCSATTSATTHHAGSCTAGTGRQLKYTVTAGDTGRVFSLDKYTGVFSVRLPFFVDFEMTKEYEVTVRATDPEGLFSEVKVSLRIDDVNENPEFARDFYTRVKETANQGTIFGETIIGYDPDDQKIGPVTMDWWKDSTSSNCVERPAPGSGDVRLAQGCTNGFIEGKMTWGEVADWEWTITTGEVISLGGDFEDSIHMYIEGQYYGFQLADQKLVLPIKSSNQLNLEWRWEFRSSGVDAAAHQVLAGNVQSTAWVNQGRYLKYEIVAGNEGPGVKKNIFGILDQGASGARLYVSRKNDMLVHLKDMYSLTIRITDPGGLYAEATYNIKVLVGNDPPEVTKRKAFVIENNNNMRANGGECSDHMKARWKKCTPDGKSTWTWRKHGPTEIGVPATTTWQQARDKCRAMDADICETKEICPRSNTYYFGDMGTWSALGKAEEGMGAESGNGEFEDGASAAGGVRSSNQWVAVRDRPNAWVQIGNSGSPKVDGVPSKKYKSEHCRMHRDSRGFVPTWGTSTEAKDFRSVAMCCQKENSYFDSDIEVGRPQSLSWQIVGGERKKYENFHINSGNGVVWKRPGGYGLNFERQNYYWLTIRLQDTGAGMLYDEAPLQIEVQDVNEAPWSYNQNVYVSENMPIGTRMNRRLYAHDWDAADSGNHVWTLLSTSSGWGRTGGSIPFELREDGDILTTGKLNYERLPIFYMRVRFTDSCYPGDCSKAWDGSTRHSGTITITILVVNENDKPVLRDSTRIVNEHTGYRSLNKDTMVGESLLKEYSEEDSFDPASWTIKSCSPGPNPFWVNGMGQIYVKNDHRDYLNYERNTFFTLEIMVTDSYPEHVWGWQRHGRLSDSAMLKVNVNDLNEAAVFRSSSTTRTVPENSPSETYVGMEFIPSDVDADQTHTFTVALQPKRFDIITVGQQRGQVRTKAGAHLDYDCMDIKPNNVIRPCVWFENSFIIAVRVTDHGGPINRNRGSPEITVGTDVTVQLLDVNEPPLLDDMLMWVFEETPTGATVGTCISTVTGKLEDCSMIAYDPDVSDTQKILYTVSAQEKRFGTRSASGLGTVIVGQETLDYEITKSYTLTIYVTDTNWAEGQWSDANAAKWPHVSTSPITTSAQLKINIMDINEAPILVQDQKRSVKENMPMDSFVGTALDYFEEDERQSHKWTITAGEWKSSWAINACDGQVRIKIPNIDYEVKTTFVLSIWIEDSGVHGFDETMNFAKMSDYTTLTINVIDVNEAPVMKDLYFAVDENSPVGTKIGSPVSNVMFEEDNLNSSPGEPDWQTHEYEIGAGNDGNAFRMDSKTGQIYIGTQNGCLLDDDATRTSCATINYERRPKFLLFVKTTDTGINGDDMATTTSLVTITINDLNEAPSFRVKTMQKMEQTVRSPMLAYDMDVTHPPNNIWCWDEDGDPYRFDIINPSQGDIIDGAPLPFIMDEKTGLVTVSGENKLDYETKNVYTFRAKCTDTTKGRAPKVTSQTIVINIIDVNENPVMPDFNFVITEDWDGKTPVGRLTSTDVDGGQNHYYSIISGAHVGPVVNEILAFRMLVDGTIYVRHASGGGGSELDFENGELKYFNFSSSLFLYGFFSFFFSPIFH